MVQVTPEIEARPVRHSVAADPIWYKEFQLQVNALVVEADNNNIMSMSILRRLYERFFELEEQMNGVLSTASNIRASYRPGAVAE